MQSTKAIVDFYESTGKDEVSTEARREILAVKRLIKYAQHKPDCASLVHERGSDGRFGSYACTCGLKKILHEID
jgi:hypothetical protein